MGNTQLYQQYLTETHVETEHMSKMTLWEDTASMTKQRSHLWTFANILEGSSRYMTKQHGYPSKMQQLCKFS